MDTDANFEENYIFKALQRMALRHQGMLGGYTDLPTALPSEHQYILKNPRQLPKAKPARAPVKEEKLEKSEVEAGTSTAPMYEPVNCTIYNLIQINGEETKVLWLAIDQKHIMYLMPWHRIIDAYTHKPHEDGTEYKMCKVADDKPVLAKK